MSMRKLVHRAVAILAGILLGSCSSSTPINTAPDMAPPYPCFMNPMTYVQIINACTTAVSVDQPATSPKFQQGATLMPLP